MKREKTTMEGIKSAHGQFWAPLQAWRVKSAHRRFWAALQTLPLEEQYGLLRDAFESVPVFEEWLDQSREATAQAELQELREFLARSSRTDGDDIPF